MKPALLLATVLLVACTPAADQTAAGPSREGNVGARCAQHIDCETPMDYVVRSSCPFVSQCIEGACAVVCPIKVHAPNTGTSVSYSIACRHKSECGCEYYQSNDMKECGCVDGRCMAIVAD